MVKEIEIRIVAAEMKNLRRSVEETRLFRGGGNQGIVLGWSPLLRNCKKLDLKL